MLEISNLQITIDGRSILSDINMSVQRGDISCLLGPSGSGKTSLLECIAGFRRPDQGQIVIDGRVIYDRHTDVATEKRRLGMVWQDFALFPHLNVEDNIAFGLHQLSTKERQRAIDEMLELAVLQSFAKRYPHELSGGQQQRVALARALAPNPLLLLLDEPFSNLDTSFKFQMIREVREILVKKGTTTLLITHDQAEALSMADTLGVVGHNRLLQWDNAYEIYHAPNSLEVATAVGMAETIRGDIEDGQIHTALGTFPLGETSRPDAKGQVEVLIRPDDIIHDDESAQLAEIVEKQFRGSTFLYRLRLNNGEKICCFASSHHRHAIGEAIGIVPDIEHLIIFAGGNSSSKSDGRFA